MALLAALMLPTLSRAGSGQSLKLTTKDGKDVEAELWPGEEGMPGIVAVAAGKRDEWAPLAEARPAGFTFVAVDAEGATAALDYLRKVAKCDEKRIGVAGASPAIDGAIAAVVKDHNVAASILLGPGPKEAPMAPADRTKGWMRSAMLLVTPEAEAQPAKDLMIAVQKKVEADVRTVAAPKDVRGTALLTKVDGLAVKLAHWYEGMLGGQVVDGVLDECEKKAPVDGRGAAVGMQVPPGSLTLKSDAVALNIAFEGSSDALQAFVLTVEPSPPGEDFVEGGMRLRGIASAGGVLLGGTLESWRGEFWDGRPATNKPDTALVAGRLVEMRLPWKMFGVRPGSKARVEFGFQQGRPDWKAKPRKASGVTVGVPE